MTQAQFQKFRINLEIVVVEAIAVIDTDEYEATIEWIKFGYCETSCGIPVISTIIFLFLIFEKMTKLFSPLFYFQDFFG